MFRLFLTIFLASNLIPNTIAVGCNAGEECDGCDQSSYKKYALCLNNTCICNALPQAKVCETYVTCSQSDCTPAGKIRSCQYGVCTCKDCQVGREIECDCKYGRSCVEGTCVCKEPQCNGDADCPACNDPLKKYPLCTKGQCVCNVIPTKKACSTWVNCKQSDCTQFGKIRSCQYGICTCKDCRIGHEKECDCKGEKRCVEGTCQCEAQRESTTAQPQS